MIPLELDDFNGQHANRQRIRTPNETPAIFIRVPDPWRSFDPNEHASALRTGRVPNPPYHDIRLFMMTVRPRAESNLACATLGSAESTDGPRSAMLSTPPVKPISFRSRRSCCMEAPPSN